MGLVVRDAGATRPENATPMLAQPAHSLIRVGSRESIYVGIGIESEFRLLCGPASLTGERHLDRAMSFSAWLLWSPSSSSSCPRTLALVKLSMMLHSAWKSTQSSEWASMQRATRDRISQHRFTTASAPLLYARRAVQAMSNLAPRVVGVPEKNACRALIRALNETSAAPLDHR